MKHDDVLAPFRSTLEHVLHRAARVLVFGAFLPAEALIRRIHRARPNDPVFRVENSADLARVERFATEQNGRGAIVLIGEQPSAVQLEALAVLSNGPLIVLWPGELPSADWVRSFEVRMRADRALAPPAWMLVNTHASSAVPEPAL